MLAGAEFERNLERLADGGNLAAGSSGISLFSITERGSVILNSMRLSALAPIVKHYWGMVSNSAWVAL